MAQSPLAKLLKEKLKELADELIEARQIAKEANDRADSLAAKVDAYKRALMAETGEAAEPPGSTSIDSLFVSEPAGDINKSQIARDVIIAKADQGATAKDLREAFRKAGVSFHPNYPYAVLKRLKKNRTIREVKGKFFPAEPQKVAG